MAKRRRRKRRFIQQAIKHEGALTRDVGGKPSANLAKVQRLERQGTPEQQRRARFYLKVLRPLNRRAKRSGR